MQIGLNRADFQFGWNNLCFLEQDDGWPSVCDPGNDPQQLEQLVGGSSFSASAIPSASASAIPKATSSFLPSKNTLRTSAIPKPTPSAYAYAGKVPTGPSSAVVKDKEAIPTGYQSCQSY